MTRGDISEDIQVDFSNLSAKVPLSALEEPLLEEYPWQPWMNNRLFKWLSESDTHSSKVVISILVAILCSVVSCFYYILLNFFLNSFWRTIPENYISAIAGDNMWIEYGYMILVTTVMGLFVGCSIYFLGFPGDLPYMVHCVHFPAYVPVRYFIPMAICSIFSITGGGSLGPEAAIVLLCASAAGVLGKTLGYSGPALRLTTLCGMACGFAAFFGVPLGGPLFALEVGHRMGIEFFESAAYAVFSGTICCTIYHYVMDIEIGQIWHFSVSFDTPTVGSIVLGAILGTVGAFSAYLFLKVHSGIKFLVSFVRVKNQILISTCTGFTLGVIGLFVPQTLFWGEFEIQTIIDRGETPFAHAWPKQQLLPYSLQNPWINCMVALVKMAAISLSIIGGYRGGFIFPFFLTGASIGSAIQLWFPNLNLVVCTMCIAVSLNVAITRTPWGSSLILASLSGQEDILSTVVSAALVSLMLTNVSKFQLIKPQRSRSIREVLLPHDEYDHSQGE